MSSFCLSTPLYSPSLPSTSRNSRLGSQCFLARKLGNTRGSKQVVCMAPDEEKMTRRSPLDFPIEWERPRPGRRPDIFPEFSPMKTPLPTPLPADDPPEEDEEEEEKEEEEEDPEQETPDEPQE